MITLITGKPGDGKTLYATREIVRVLRETDFFVVTDVPLTMGRLREYVNEGRKDSEVVDLDNRLRVINPEEAHAYWRYRSGGLVLDQSPDALSKDDGVKRMPKLEFDAWARSQFERIAEKPEYQKGVYYVIDEAHEKFPARDWQSIGRVVTYHASKHRHLHDEVWLLTQAPDFLDKTLRSLVSEARITRNNLRRNVGMFKLRGVFKVRHYYGIPSGPTIAPFSTEEMQLDAAGLASCYQTVGAFGVHSKPEKLVNKGRLPWWSLWVGSAVLGGSILAAVFILPQIMVRKVQDSIAGSVIAPPVSGTGVEALDGLKAVMPGPVVPAPVASPAPVREAVQAEPVVAPRIVGVLERDGQSWVVLEDGSTMYGVQERRPGQVRIAGMWLAVRGRSVSVDERQLEEQRRREDREFARARAKEADDARAAMLAAGQPKVSAEDQAWAARVAEGSRLGGPTDLSTMTGGGYYSPYAPVGSSSILRLR